MTLTHAAFAAFAMTAAGGLLLATLVGLRLRFPAWLGTGHGLAGLLSLCVLFAANLRGGDATPVLAWWSLGVLFGGFLGGMVLFRVIFRDRATLPLAAVHGTVGALGLYLLYRALT